MHVDTEMMDEIKQVHAALNPIETLFTVDAMTGQDAANTAKAFNEALPLTGVILTKVDGDARVVRRYQFVKSLVNQSNSWVWVRKQKRLSRSIQTVSLPVFWVWAMCFH